MRKHGAYDALTTPGTPRGRKILPAIAHRAHVSLGATSSPIRARASYSTSFTLDKFPSVRRKKVAVGMPVTQHPPHRSRRAVLPHRALASGRNAQALRRIRMHNVGFRKPLGGELIHP